MELLHEGAAGAAAACDGVLDFSRLSLSTFSPDSVSEDDADTARPDLDQPVISSLPNLYCLRNPLDITLDTSNKSLLKV